jgi:hypothetical protein
MSSEEKLGDLLPPFGYAENLNPCQSLIDCEAGYDRAIGEVFNEVGRLFQEGFDLRPERRLRVLEDGPQVVIWREDAVHEI